MKFFIAVFFAALGLCTLNAANLLVNSDFSRLNKQDFPAYWSIVSNGGAKSAEIAGPDGKIVKVMEFDLAKHPKATRIEQVPTLVPNRTYKVSFYAKSENLSKGSVYLTTLRWSGGASQHISGTTPWKKYEFTTKFPGPDSRYRLILFAPKGATGKLWFYDVQVEEILAKSSAAEAFVTIPQIAQSPVIDGKLDDAAWKSVPSYTPFVEMGKSAYTQFAKDNTEFYLAHDSRNLYAAFKCYAECLDPVRNQLDLFQNHIKNRDGAVVKDDCVRLFISNGGAQDAVYEFTVNSLGTLKDAKCVGEDIWVGRDLSFNTTARSAGKVYNGFYIVEIAIPLAELALTPAPGKELKIMAGRINPARKSATLYFPREKAFHLRSVLGKAVWGGTVPAISECRLNLEQAANRILAFSSNAAGTVTLNATGENNRTAESKFNIRAGLNKHRYTLPGKEYNTVAFAFAANGKVFWQTPAYVIGNAMTNTTIYSKGMKSSFTAEQGIYPAPSAPLKLQKTGYPGIFEIAGTPKNLAVSQTLFWPGNNNEFHVASGSLQPLHVVAVTGENKLAGLKYQLNVILPETFSIEAATAPYRKDAPIAIENVKKLTIQGKVYNHYTLTAKQVQQYKMQPANSDIYTLLIRCNQKYSTKNKTAVGYVFAAWGNNNIVEVPQVLNITVYPELANKAPKFFQSEMWGGAMVNLADRDANLRFLLDTVKKSGFTRLQNFPVPGMKRFGVLAYQRIINPHVKELLHKHPDWRKINSTGSAVPMNQPIIVCTDILINSPEIAAIGARETARQLQGFDILCFDYENPVKDGALSCYCDRCLKRFADFAKLSAVPQRAEIHQKYNAQWQDFMTTRIAQICAMWKKIVNAQGKEFYFYSGYQSPKSLAHYSVDWRKLVNNIDRGGAGYTRTAKEIKDTADALKNTPLLSGVIAEPWHVYLRQKSVQIDMAYLAAGLINGSKGFMVYNLPGCDGRSFHNFSEFNRFLADHEDTLYNASRSRSRNARVQGINGNNYMLFTQPGKPAIMVCFSTEAKRRQIYVNVPFANCREYFSGKKISGKKYFTFMINPGEMLAFIEEK